MAPRPTKTPILTHAAQQNVQRFPAPRNPTHNSDKQEPLLQSSASQPNLVHPTKQLLPNDASQAFLKPDEKPVYQRSKSCFLWVVLCLSCWAMFGSYYCYDNPTALSNQFRDEYNLSDTQYNLLYSVYSFPNIILPLFGGALIDRIGAETSLLIFLCFITAGQALFAFAASIKSYPLMLVGRSVYGLGGESLCVAESALLAVYFMGTEVAFAMGLNLSLGRSGSSLNDYATLRIYEANNSIPQALWAGFLLLCVCLLFTVIMVVLDALKTRQKEKQGFAVPQAHSGEVVQLKEICDFGILYWLLTVSCIVIYGCVLPWNNIGSSFLQAQYGYSRKKGNYLLMLPYLISAVCCPFFGYVCDRLGKRCQLLLASSGALMLSHAMFAWFTWINPIIALTLMGIAYSIYASAIWPAVALVVKESKLGTAYGFITAVQNCGLAVFPIIVGTLTQSEGDPKSEYYYVEVFLFGLALFGVVVGALLWWKDVNGAAVLAQPSIQKDPQGTTRKEFGDTFKEHKVQLLSEQNEAEDEANISLQTPQLMYEQHDDGELVHTPVALQNN